jgi:alkylation response protein AidB-like acyl-CoA dehydrogenase
VEGWNIVKAGRKMDVATKLRFRRNSAMAVKMTSEAVDNLHEMAGANGIYDKYPIQRMFRDARVHSIGGGATEIMLEEVAKRMV